MKEDNVERANLVALAEGSIHHETGLPCPVGSECYPKTVLLATFEPDSENPGMEKMVDLVWSDDPSETLTKQENSTNPVDEKMVPVKLDPLASENETESAYRENFADIVEKHPRGENENVQFLDDAGFGMHPTNKVAIIGSPKSGAGIAASLAATDPVKDTKQQDRGTSPTTSAGVAIIDKKLKAQQHNEEVRRTADVKQVVVTLRSKGTSVILNLRRMTTGQIQSDRKAGRYAVFSQNRVATSTKVFCLPNSYTGMPGPFNKLNLSDTALNNLLNSLGETIAFEVRNNRLQEQYVGDHHITLTKEEWVARGYNFNSSGNVDLG